MMSAVTYEELDARSNRRARMLAAHGVGHGDFVTVALPNGLEFYETTFAIWKLGAIPNVVAAKLARPEMEAILDLVRPKIFIGTPPDPGIPALAGDQRALDRYSTDAAAGSRLAALESDDEWRLHRAAEGDRGCHAGEMEPARGLSRASIPAT